MTTDTYLSNISNESLEILRHFGPEAPAKLNTYANRLEDELLKALETQKSLQHELTACRDYIEKVQPLLQTAQEERERMIAILTDPERLIDYIGSFFGPQGPFPGGAVISRCQSDVPIG